MPEEINYEEIYEGWSSLPQCRVHINTGDGGENLWGRSLPDGTRGLDNNPLNDGYRYQDIVESTGSAPKVLHRRWNAMVWYEYDEPEDKDEALVRRKVLLSVLKPIGFPSFFTVGTGYVLLKDAKDAVNIVQGVLSPLDFIKTVVPVED